MNPATASPAPRALMLVVGAQLLGTSLWFSANAAAPDLARTWQLGSADLGRLTNAVQLGFILGTLGAAISGLADRYPASRIFAQPLRHQRCLVPADVLFVGNPHGLWLRPATGVLFLGGVGDQA